MGPDDFATLWERLDLAADIMTVDGSATFCESVVP